MTYAVAYSFLMCMVRHRNGAIGQVIDVGRGGRTGAILTVASGDNMDRISEMTGRDFLADWTVTA